MSLLNGDFAKWSCSARCVHIDGPRIIADSRPAKVGAALSMGTWADGAHSWTSKRLSNGGSGISDYLGACIGAASICLSATPTSGSFNGFVVGFRATASVGGDLRYKTSGSLLQPWQRRLPILKEAGSVLNFTLDHEAGTVTFRAPELENSLIPRHNPHESRLRCSCIAEHGHEAIIFYS